MTTDGHIGDKTNNAVNSVNENWLKKELQKSRAEHCDKIVDKYPEQKCFIKHFIGNSCRVRMRKCVKILALIYKTCFFQRLAEFLQIYKCTQSADYHCGDKKRITKKICF